MRVETKVAVKGGSGKLQYEDRNYPERTGWKEIVVGDGPDRSQALTAYPTDATVPQPQDLREALDITGSAPVVAQTAPVPEPVAAPAPATSAPPVEQPRVESAPAPPAATSATP